MIYCTNDTDEMDEKQYHACERAIPSTNKADIIVNWVVWFHDTYGRDKHDYYVKLLWTEEGSENPDGLEHDSIDLDYFTEYFRPFYYSFHDNHEQKQRNGWTFLWENLCVGFTDNFKIDLGWRKRDSVYVNTPNGFYTHALNIAIQLLFLAASLVYLYREYHYKDLFINNQEIHKINPAFKFWPTTTYRYDPADIEKCRQFTTNWKEASAANAGTKTTTAINASAVSQQSAADPKDDFKRASSNEEAPVDTRSD